MYPRGRENIAHTVTHKITLQQHAVSAPKLWNSLPLNFVTIENFTSFKFNLKTYFFKEYFQ